MMNKKQYIIITIIVLVVILIGLGFYFKTNIQKMFSTQTDEDIINILQEPKPLEVNPDTSKSETPESPTTADINKFTQSMINARSAYNKKDYGTALRYYNEALIAKNSDVPYSGMYNVYLSEGNWVKAREVIDQAIKLNPLNAEYWKSKLTLLDEKTNTSFLELKKIYEEGLLKIDPRTKADLITHFALIAENNNEKTEAIALWQEAIKVYPDNKAMYQAEIDRLKQ